MPIDIRQLAQNESELENYRNSLRLRIINDEHLEQQQQQLLEQALQLLASSRDVWKEAKRSQDCNQQEDSNSLTAAEKYQQLQSQLQTIISKLPNVYRRIDAENAKETISVSADHNNSNMKSDVMFAIGGYEQLGNHGIFYTDVGIALIQSMHEYILRWWTKQRIFQQPASFRHWKLPAMLSRTKHSWQVILEENHGNQKYFDRELPIFYLLQCEDGHDGPTAAVDQTSETKAKRRTRKYWYQQKSTSWQILVITGPSYEVDVKPLQQQLMQDISSFYQSIGLTPHCKEVVTPSKLLPHQANRIDWTLGDKLLADLVNYDQFLPEAGKHAHSGERLCTLHGTLCHIPSTLESLLERGFNGQNVTVPRFLQRRPINVIRRRVCKKNGQWTVQLVPQKSPTPTPHDIRMEAASCPFDFLPFYYK